MPSATLMQFSFCTEQEKKKKTSNKMIKFRFGGGAERGEGKKSLDDLNTIIYGPIHSDDVVI